MSANFYATLCGHVLKGGLPLTSIALNDVGVERNPLGMTWSREVSLAATVLQNNSDKAEPLLLLVDALIRAHGDPLGEAIVLDVKKFIYSKTEHSEQGMARFISDSAIDSSDLAA